MSWEDILKEDAMRNLHQQLNLELKRLVGKEGKLEDFMEMIDKEFGLLNVKTRIIYNSSSQPVLGFELPIFVRCEIGTKDRPNTKDEYLMQHRSTSEFTIKDVGINKSHNIHNSRN
tara:strand:+ start:4008 stop:4355 length:348 start_codon:yes stop_codon:yes gene_type:complete